MPSFQSKAQSLHRVNRCSERDRSRPDGVKISMTCAAKFQIYLFETLNLNLRVGGFFMQNDAFGFLNLLRILRRSCGFRSIVAS